MCTNTLSCCVYTVSCFDVKTEADSDDIIECLHDDKSSIGRLCFSVFSCFTAYVFKVNEVVCSAFVSCLCIRLSNCNAQYTHAIKWRLKMVL